MKTVYKQLKFRIHEYDQLHLGYTEYRATINIVEARK